LNLSSALDRLKRSAFRAAFRLTPADVAYARARGRETLQKHARDFLIRRIAPAAPAKDGRQTPMKGHPVFTAQHATATCCRGCIKKWHGIEKGRPLTEEEIDGLVMLITAWIEKQLEAEGDATLRHHE